MNPMRMSRNPATWLALVVASVALVCAPVFRNGFVYDDVYVIERGDVIHDLARLPEVFVHPTMFVSTAAHGGGGGGVDTYRPLSVSYVMLASALSGREPFAYHLFNLLLHLLNVVLVYFVACRLRARTGGDGYAVLAAAAFGFSPQLAEAHVWMLGCSDVLCTAFALSGILVWRLSFDPGRTRAARFGRLAASTLLFTAGLLSKEVLLPAFAALALWPRREPAQGEDAGARWLGLAPLAAATGLYLPLRWNALGSMATHGDGAQLFLALERIPLLLLDAAAQLVWPSKLYLRSLYDEYAAVPSAWLALAAVLVAVLGGALGMLRRRLPALAWSAAWAAATLAPAAMVTTMLWPGFGRYLYMPYAMLAIGLAELVEAVAHARPRWQSWTVGVAMAHVVASAGLLRLYVYDYESEETLYGAIIRRAPELPHGHGWLGMSRLRTGRIEQAIAPLSEAVRLAPAEPRYLSDLGGAFRLLQDRERTLSVVETGVRRFPPGGSFRLLAINLLHDREPETAADHMVACLDADRGDRRCGEALQRALTEHPQRERYRVHVRQLVASGRYAWLGPALGPLL